MFLRLLHVVVVAASLAMGAFLATPTSAVPIHPVEIGKGAASAIDQASFWGLPYPYGYSYRHHCWKRVRVQTEMGWRWERVWVCD